MAHTAPVLLPVAELFTTSSKQFSRIHPLRDGLPLLRWIINAHFNRLSLAAFHPLILRQGLSSHFFGKKVQICINILIYSAMPNYPPAK
jgi:hypothetical protein